ncbi:hypothetical protein SAMN06314019_10824 [Epsilonproteobacteria bacterium SCGC AD-311-C15]|nr:hypothetical protein SAMN06314019_10824 [Epsilonproteobacteria bacterium SCGC AD-311-C15]
MSIEKKLIDDIKQEYLEEKNKKQNTIKNMWTQYQKMGKELSEGIYAEDNHFIYELIQNAEDTISIENTHSLEFELENEGLLVFNNEMGFNEEQIKAICSFGQSTKAIEKNEGYIGEKGIGFKSVFKITDKPAIYSNGYRFYFNRFDESGTTTEYIIPYWIDDNILKQYPLKFQNNTHTTLYLPFSKDQKHENITKLRDGIKHIEPILLLFLKKLTNIKISESGKNVINTVKTSQKDEQLDVINIQNKNITEHYYVFNKSIEVDSNLDEVKDKNGRRKNVFKREIILAFPDLNKNKIKEDRIFSFLPTKLHSELEFIIQADFILQSGRENIAIDNDWNKWQFNEIEKFISYEIISALKNHTKLKLKYFNYFTRNGNSHNSLIEKLYTNIINYLKTNNTILAENDTWQKPQNIILFEENIKIDTKYLKLLFGKESEQVHEKFELDQYFINKFQIKKITKKEVIEKICDYFDSKALNDFSKKEVLYFTQFLGKYLNIDSRALSFEKELFERVKESLPILPKYKNEKKLYLCDTIYISSEYKPNFMIESICKEKDFDFSKYNFLSNDYLDENNKSLENFIRKIIEEQKENKNKRTLDFFTKYPLILQNYLIGDIQKNYSKILDYLIENQEDNKDRISKIPFILTHSWVFQAATENIYFSNDNDTELEVLNSELFKLLTNKTEYKEFFTKVFKVKDADIINIIINEYLPWINKNEKKRDKQNDKKLLDYTKSIIENFGKLEKEEKYKIKSDLFFISSNDRKKYRKSSNIYLPQNISEIVFNADSIEKYITNKSIFEFLDESYNQILNTLDEEKIKEFFKYFSFEKNIKDNDVVNFIKYVKQSLNLKQNIEALELIIKSIDNKDGIKIEEIKNFEVYSQNEKLIKIENLFSEKVNKLDIDFLHEDYKEQIGDLYFKSLRQYFLSEYNIEPFIKYLKENLTFNEAIEVYKYLEQKNPEATLRDHNKNHTITTEKIRQKFKADKLIYGKDGKTYFPPETTWKEEKSNADLFTLSIDYPKELQKFFVKIVQVSQSKDIRQIINQFKPINGKDNHYFNLLIDLNDLISDNNELDKYVQSYNNKINGKYSSNIYENAKKFILKDEQVFILDNDKKNKDESFYFNDLEIENYDEKLENQIFSINRTYPLGNYEQLINTLKIKCLSAIDIIHSNRRESGNSNISDFRKMLDFAYDKLFTKFPDKYRELEKRQDELKELNSVNKIKIYDDIISSITVNKISIEVENVKFYFKDNVLSIVEENDLFKIISDIIGFISDKDIKDFYNEVVVNSHSKESYYKKENIKVKQNFPLDISDVIPEKYNATVNNAYKQEDEDNSSENDYNEEERTENIEPKSEEEKRNERKRGTEQIEDHEREIASNLERELELSIVKNSKEFQEDFKKSQTKRILETLDNSTSISEKIKNKIKQEISYNDNNKIASNQKMEKFGSENTKSKFASKEWYRGQCQICGYTFRTNRGINHFERFTWTDFGRGEWTTKQKRMNEHNLIDASNSLCLCSRCHSILKHGGDFKATFLTSKSKNKLTSDDYAYDEFIIDMEVDKLMQHPECFKEHIEWRDMYFLEIKLNKHEEYIYFTEEHLIAFFQFLKS